MYLKIRVDRGEDGMTEAVITWESECLPKIESRNAAGDIAICTLWTPVNQISSLLDLSRINMIGPLRTKAGLGWLLRGLYLHPDIRNLVLYGEDLLKAGDALVRLWENGLSADNTLPGSGCKLYPEMSKEAVNRLRKYVKVWDWRGKSLEEVIRNLPELPYLPPEMEPQSFPPVTIPQQVSFSSRKTTFPLFADEVGDAWIQLLNLVMRCGTVKRTRRGERLTEVLNAIVTMKLADKEETVPPCFDFDADEFQTYYQHFISPRPPEYTNYTYGERLQKWAGSNWKNGKEAVNQLRTTIDRLQRSLDTKRATMVLLDPIDLEKLDDAPCIISITFNVVAKRLYGTYVMRSDDVYNGWPLTALSLIRLQREVSKALNVPVDSATFISHSAHIYERDWARALDKLNRWFRRPLPFQPDCSGLFFFSVEGKEVRALLVTPEVDRVLWEGTSSDPGELIRYIVDTMPWLTPQHIRYLGEEAAKLVRALQEGVPYEQG